MLAFFIVLIVLGIVLAIKPVRQALGSLAIVLLFCLPFAWAIFVIYVIIHFVRKYW